MEITEDQIYELQLTPEQLKAAKKVYSAIKAAGKLGVNFWDNYGTLTCYNSKKIEVPIMEDNVSWKERNNEDVFIASNSGCDGDGYLVLYWDMLDNFFAGNADDTFYAKIK